MTSVSIPTIGTRPEGPVSAFDWQDDALCAQIGPDAFFVEKGESTADAKKLCAKCPVAAPCLDYAVENGERHGIWGGKTVREIRRIGQARELAA